MSGLLDHLPSWAWRHSHAVKAFLDVACWVAAIPLAFLVRNEFTLGASWLEPLVLVTVAMPTVLAIESGMRLHRQSWGYAGSVDLTRLFLAAAFVGLFLFFVTSVFQVFRPDLAMSRSVPIVAGILAFGAMGTLRLLVRIGREGYQPFKGPGVNILVVGAGPEGVMLARELRGRSDYGLRLVGFLDGDRSRQNLRYDGIPVLGRPAQAEWVVREHDVTRVLFADPGMEPAQRRQLQEKVERLGVEFRAMPGLDDLLLAQSPARLQTMLRSFTNHAVAKNVLVIGGGGYIGSALAPMLLDQGYHVRILDSFIYGRSPIASFSDHDRLELLEGDFRNVDTVVEAMQGMDTVVHLGAIVGDPSCALDEDLTVETNLIATKVIAQIAKGFGIQRFIFASTCSVYGASDDLLDEDSPLNPVSLYAKTKIASERVLERMVDGSFRPILLRFGTVYGFSGRTRFDLVVNLLTAKAVTDGKITLFGGDQWRPFVHVEDVAKAVLHAVQAPIGNLQHFVYNVGSNEQNHTLSQVAEIIQSKVPGSRIIDSGADQDRRNYRVRFDRIHQEMGFVPGWGLEDGIDQVLAAFNEGRITDITDAQYSNIRFFTEGGMSNMISRVFGDVYDVLLEDPVGPAPGPQDADGPGDR